MMKTSKFNLMLCLTLCLGTVVFGISCSKKVTPTSSSSSIGNGNPAQNPSGGSGWPPLQAICSDPNATAAEELVCGLDALLEEMESAGKQLSDYNIEFQNWIDLAIDLRSDICQSSPDITFLAVGSLQVLAARNLIILPVNIASILAANSVHATVKRIISEVVDIPLSLSCNINLQELSTIAIIGGGSNSGGTTTGGSTTGGAVNAGSTSSGSTSGGSTTGSSTTGGVVNAGSGSGSTSGGSTNSGTINGGTGGSKCDILQDRYELYCEPHCLANGTCNAGLCNQTNVQCQQMGCSCN